MSEDIDPLDSLDIVYELPEEIASNPKLLLMYEVIINRMRKEAVNLPLNTVHQLLIERIAFNYIVLRQKERGELGGFSHSTAQKDFNTFWLSMTQELNKNIRAFEEKRQERLLKTMRDVVMSTLSSIEDQQVQRDLLERFAEAFEKAGI